MSEIKLPEDIQNDIRKSAEDALLLNIKFGIPLKFVAKIQ